MEPLQPDRWLEQGGCQCIQDANVPEKQGQAVTQMTQKVLRVAVLVGMWKPQFALWYSRGQELRCVQACAGRFLRTPASIIDSEWD